MNRRYFLRLIGVSSDLSNDLMWVQFRTRRAARAWATLHRHAYTDPRVSSAADNTRWLVMDRGPWWQRTFGQRGEPVEVAHVDGLTLPGDGQGVP